MSDWRNIGLDANRLRQLYDEARAEVSSLRTERDRYREALGNLFDMATEFSTQADYTVEGGIESDFSEALDLSLIHI